MKTLYFIDSNKQKHFVACNDNSEVLLKEYIADRQRRHIQSSPYTRHWVDDDGLWIDFGSWFEFYLIEGATILDIIS